MWAIVGRYETVDTPGGLSLFDFDTATGALTSKGIGDRALQAGFVVHDPHTDMVYCVDERKTDGRGPVGPAAAVHAFAFNRREGSLSWRDMQAVPGPFPTFLDLHCERRVLLSASHGSFDHVEQVVPDGLGGWRIDFVYDASTLALHRLTEEGDFAGLLDLVVLEGHGKDPNFSPQAGGHCQSGPHAHCATLDPPGRNVIVCDKGTDTILVYRLSQGVELIASFEFPPETAPRHVAFSPDGQRLYVTLELASELACMEYDAQTGALSLLSRVSTTGADVGRVNEPAEVRCHPDTGIVYVNNRGEDSLAWFSSDDDGMLARMGHVSVAPSVHPGLAARSFTLSCCGGYLIFADRPADLLRVYSLDPRTGTPTEVESITCPSPAYIALIPKDLA